jgi:malate dehydrogenase (oxaloacetate-decarboxylating)(NADP+)
MDSGIARLHISDWAEYDLQLARRQGQDNSFIRNLVRLAQQAPKRVVFTDGESLTVLRAVAEVRDQKMAIPILLGNPDVIHARVREHNMDIGDTRIIDHRAPRQDRMRETFAQLLHEKRKRKGMTLPEATNLMRDRNYFGAVLLETGEADVLISGLTRNYPQTLRPALQVIGRQPGIRKVSGMYVLLSRFGPIFLSDTTVNMNPNTAEIVEIAETTGLYSAEIGH